VDCLTLVFGLSWELEGLGTVERGRRADFADLVGVSTLDSGLLGGLGLCFVALKNKLAWVGCVDRREWGGNLMGLLWPASCSFLELRWCPNLACC
jgi:hypothetical protein